MVDINGNLRDYNVNDNEISKYHKICNEVYLRYHNINNGMRCKHIACILQNGLPKFYYKMNHHLIDDLNGQNNKNKSEYTIHAEICALMEFLRSEKYLIKIKNISQIKKIYKNKKIQRNIKRKCSMLDIFVIRFRSDGVLLNSKPCDNCYNNILMHNFKNIIYSTGDQHNPFIKIKLNKFQN